MFSVFWLIILDVQCVLLNYFGCSVCFVELLDVKCVLFNYFGC